MGERTQRLRELDRLNTRFQQLQTNFAPPRAADLAFQPRAAPSAPKLEYNSTNAPVHGYEEGLTRLLTELDGVESGGDVEVRTTRKALASRVEGEAQRVERWRREVFEAKQAGRTGPEWQRAEPASVHPPRDGRDGTSSHPGSAPTSGQETPASASSNGPDEREATAADIEEPETPVDEVVYHAQPPGK